MILPIPSQKQGADIQLVDFSKVAGLFDVLDSCFPRIMAQSMRGTLSMENNSYSADTLKVHQIGDYQCSIVPTVHDFGRLRADTFQVSPPIGSLLQEHYPSGFAFLVCRFLKGGSFHPIGYSHSVQDGRIFIPTRHEHGTSLPHGTSFPQGMDYTSGSGLSTTFTRLRGNQTADTFGSSFVPLNQPPEWDHDIYLCNVASVERQPMEQSLSVVSNYSSLTTVPFEKSLLSWPITVPKPIHQHLLQKVSIKGAWENKDLWEWDINKIINHPVCTSNLTGKRFVIQPWYECKTCKLTDNLGCCAQCARACHKAKGHQIAFRFICPSCFCDCNEDRPTPTIDEKPKIIMDCRPPQTIDPYPTGKSEVSPFISCNCPELSTWHPGRLEHKLKCQKFWALNPGRTKEELLKVEGF